jgi:ureidoglycolate lyase
MRSSGMLGTALLGGLVTSTRVIRPQPLTPTAFAPFGDVVAPRDGASIAANLGTAARFDRITALTSSRRSATPNVALFRSTAQALPRTLTLLERHACSSQLFVPMHCARYLVVVAPTALEGGPDEDGIVAFLGGPGVGINYRAGTWHHPLLALDDGALFLMVAHEDGTPIDCEERPLRAPVVVDEAP